MENYNEYFNANKEGWNKRTAVHKTSSFYDVDGFKNGKSSLNKIELEELGSVKGKSLLHLQCHFGMDTLSWARDGAIVTGVDISDEAIKTANELSATLNIPAQFVCCNVYDTSNFVHEQFDIVFTSYGTIGWLPDLKPWAKMIAERLKPGGVFYIADFHPTLWMYNDAMEKIEYSYFNDEVIETTQTSTYANKDAEIEYKEYGWNHPFSEILDCLINEGLQLQFLHEFSYSPYNCFNNVEQGEDGMWRFVGRGNKFPMMYSIKAVKL